MDEYGEEEEAEAEAVVDPEAVCGVRRSLPPLKPEEIGRMRLMSATWMPKSRSPRRSSEKEPMKN